IVEFHHRKFDDFVLRRVEPRGFNVEQNANPGFLPCARSKFGARDELSEHPILGGLRKGLGYCGYLDLIRRPRINPLWRGASAHATLQRSWTRAGRARRAWSDLTRARR